MGNSLPSPTSQSKSKRVLIVGFSYAGRTLASSLWDHFDVTVIDEKDYFEHIFSNVKYAVDPKMPELHLTPFEQETRQYPKMKFVRATLRKVNTNNTVNVDINGVIQVMEFDILVLCTGALYGMPIKDRNAITIAERFKSAE